MLVSPYSRSDLKFNPANRRIDEGEVVLSSQKMRERRVSLFPTEILCLLYMLLTGLLIFFCRDRILESSIMLLNRVEILFGMLVFLFLHLKVRSRLTWSLRILFQLMLLSYWYPETYRFHVLFDNYDHIFASIDQWLFGCQPALEFQCLIPYWWFSELLHFGYFVYYALFVGVIFFFYVSDYREAERVAFIVMGAFFVYYIIYIFLPVAGPQFYYPAISYTAAKSGDFTPVHSYFAMHPELPKGEGYYPGIFYRLVNFSQQMGERPTAAFPSSHVGISTIVMLLLYRQRTRPSHTLFWFIFPVYTALCLATVYIEAHYLIDVFAGIVSGILFWYLGSVAYRRIVTYRP